jgi:hypothetical protein
MARNTRDPQRGQAAREMIEQTPRMQLYPLSVALGKKAADFASTLFLRGADSVYVAAADMTGSTLITSDNEMRERAREATVTLTPAEWLGPRLKLPVQVPNLADTALEVKHGCLTTRQRDA